ncbi:Bacterial extracellular solute-binding protein [Vibrio aerogenes CECT 7868]|uniref:Bacterial extracellular solute-binding protein n=1 Tax=Vibrio aerogenes CECT 7868 TaxID=1216006 RepID=A0A1M6CIT8_9VIBR|nr:extracellular solute-binding protein [Vibrio aerogenes]SHI60823.1 Bacterial extracellular solute-binding protein [Vibrio aerogenes CECT 7868]
MLSSHSEKRWFGHTILILLSYLPAQVFGKNPTEITLWRHLAGEAEMMAYEAAIERFNQSQNQWKIVSDYIYEAAYTQSINAAAKAKILPCIIDVDQPLIPNFAWQGFLQPLDQFIESDVLDKITPSGKGYYRGRLYSAGQFEAVLSLFTRKSLLKAIKARFPTIEHPWDKDEFMQVMDKIKATGRYDYPLDIKANDLTEWIPYAWAPWMLSWGADLINRNNYYEVDGILNSEKAVEFGQWIHSLVREKYINPKPNDKHGFLYGRVAIQYNGSWALNEYSKALGKDLAILPVPDFGAGPMIGAGSWQWGITTSCPYPDAAKAFINFLLSDKEIAAISEATSMIPTSAAAAALTKNYSASGQWHFLFSVSDKLSKYRPATPAYPVISSSYKKAISDILQGLDPQTAFDLAVENIEAAIERHQYYSSREQRNKNGYE